MKKHLLLACASACFLFVVGCAAEQPDAVTEAESAPAAEAATAETPAAPEQATPAAAQTPPPAAPQTPPAAPAKFVAPIRGDAELGHLKPVVKRDGKMVVTVIRVKNLSTTGSIAGLKVDEYWYDKAGNPVTGDTFRHRKPLMPGEEIEVTLRTPVSSNMHNNQLRFSHANGNIKPKMVQKF